MHASWQEVAPGVWQGRYRPFDVTVAAVVGDGACLLVDTGSGLRQAEQVREDLAALGLPPVTHVVNTHAHADHCFGNAVFAEDAEVWAHRRCAAELAERGEAQRAHLLALATDEDTADDVRQAPIVAPDALVDDLADIVVGGRAVRLRFLGAGHTDHDLVVDVADVRVAIVGDLVEQSGPPAFSHSHPLAWPDTLDRLRALRPTVVVPGHGAPVGSLFVADQQADLAEVADLVARVRRGELSEKKAVATAPLPEPAVREALARGAGS